MSFSDEELAKRLRNMATDAHLSDDHVRAKVLDEAAARILSLTHLKPDWHPSLTAATEFEKSYVEIVDWIVKNPFEGEF